MSTAFVTGADRGLGLGFVTVLLQRGWTVVAGHLDEDASHLKNVAQSTTGTVFPVRLDVTDEESARGAAEITRGRVDTLDLLINNAGVLGTSDLDHTIRDGLDYRGIMNTIDVNALGPLRVVQMLVDLMQSSSMKRLCFISSEAASITRSYRGNWFGYCMSKTALNMGISILFNDLRKEGFTFRVYHPGWMRTFMKGEKDINADLEPEEAADIALAYFLNNDIDEDKLVMRDNEGAEWPW